MDFIGIKQNLRPIKEMHKNALVECTEVLAAVAYVDNQQIHQKNFIEACFEAKIPLTLYARYDDSIPISLDVLKWFLQQDPGKYHCSLVPDILHSKIIWYRSCGIYIGSANLTCNAWNRNIEAGVFMSQSEAEQNGLLQEIEDYFTFIKSRSYSLDKDIYDKLVPYQQELSKLAATRQETLSKFPRLPAITYFDAPKSRNDTAEVSKGNFLKEWNDTLQILRYIGNVVSTEYRPSWVSSDVPQGVQTDGFLHAYYYQNVRIGNEASKHIEMHENNITNREQAQRNAMEWWATLNVDVHDEKTHMYDWAPQLRNYFSKSRILNLSEDDFADAMSNVHAFYTYARQADICGKGFSQVDRCEMLAREVFRSKNESGDNILQFLKFVLYGGTNAEMSERIYASCYDRTKKFRYIGLSTIGEIVGWALPDDFPPRNGRTSKALYALGYDVKIYTE